MTSDRIVILHGHEGVANFRYFRMLHCLAVVKSM